MKTWLKEGLIISGLYFLSSILITYPVLVFGNFTFMELFSYFIIPLLFSFAIGCLLGTIVNKNFRFCFKGGLIGGGISVLISFSSISQTYHNFIITIDQSIIAFTFGYIFGSLLSFVLAKNFKGWIKGGIFGALLCFSGLGVIFLPYFLYESLYGHWLFWISIYQVLLYYYDNFSESLFSHFIGVSSSEFIYLVSISIIISFIIGALIGKFKSKDKKLKVNSKK